MSDNSGRGEGGVEVFNQELAEALARHHNVTLFTANPEMPQHEGIQKVVTTQPPMLDLGPGVEGEPEQMERRDWIKYLAGQEPRQYGLEDPASKPYDIIVAHSRFSGPAAVELRENWYRDARVVHFLHTSPERLPYVKGFTPEKAEYKAVRDSSIERAAMGRADVVAGVGPLLSEVSRELSAQGVNVPHSHEVMPGTRVQDPVVHDPAPERLNLLVMGRVDDPLKGVADAAKAVKLLNEAGTPVHLTVRGIPTDRMQAELANLGRLTGGNVTVKPRTSSMDEINEDIRGSHAVIMPSKHEGFGMVAPEGLAHGVPVLVNEESGAARFLQDPDRVPPEIGGPCVVAEPTDGTSRAEAWAKAIGGLYQDLPQRQAGALHLRETLQEYTWDHAAEATVEAAMSQPPLTRRDPRSLLTAQERDAARTVQGPNGQLLRPEAPEQAPQTPERAGPEISAQRDGPEQAPQAPQAPQTPQQAGPETAAQPEAPAQDSPAPEPPVPAWQAGFIRNRSKAASPRAATPPESSAPTWQAGFTRKQRGTASPGRGAGEGGTGRGTGHQPPPPELPGPSGGVEL
ncbi:MULTISPECIES: glycosyltransferase family 4 protein [unclassified Streptomyces]|uniref:glycosyltransferase family 4 protein n=1 Tax=unclassified Streptomyces TaxID=2593676 RepID=UPI002259E445|nr:MULTISPECIES: glycosyltransferase [unclassified Streptomyces]MCX4526466.1 glycosyltransferase [Streptomyces sp. NBC_01551]MCX4542971.1 glycosyltransferase [Streptomyces sp. NBC_01565]